MVATADPGLLGSGLLCGGFRTEFHFTVEALDGVPILRERDESPWESHLCGIRAAPGCAKYSRT
jgi:hypothetical protein